MLKILISNMNRYVFILMLASGVCFAQTHPYQDLTHDSKAFGKSKPFRLYLPEGYSQSNSNYPVIYYFHGNGGRSFYDNGANIDFDKIGDLVNKYQVMMVMWDGNVEESDYRVYNTGNHESVVYQVQMKDYFLELTDYIDANYRTLTGREHRGIIGFSMGGCMAMFIAGKYPDMVSAIVPIASAPEYFIGYPDNHSLFSPRYTLENLTDVAVRFYNMEKCPLICLNIETKNAAIWEGLNNFEYWQFKTPHQIDEPGETRVFESAMQFIVNRFHHPVPLRKSWSHYELYADCDLWGYSVKSNKKEPGYLYLRNVTPAGFGFYTRKWLPDGLPLKNCTAKVVTAPIYKKGDTYDIMMYRQGADKPVTITQKADQDGRLHVDLDGEGYEISITHKTQPADFVVLDHTPDFSKRNIRVNDVNDLTITFLNRGGNAYTGKKVQLKIYCADPSVTLFNAEHEIALDKSNNTFKSQPIGIYCTKTPPEDASPAWIKLNVVIRCDNDVFHDALSVPVNYDLPYFANIKIDDGVFVSGGTFGTGNRNGQADASERIMIYENFQRLRLFTDDPYVLNESETLHDQVLPGLWLNGVTFSSIVKIADHCPPGHTIEFLAYYETKTFMPICRKQHWGKVKVTVGN